MHTQTFQNQYESQYFEKFNYENIQTYENINISITLF